MRFKRILLPVNGSPESLRAAEFALTHAGEDQAEYVLLHVFEPVPLIIGGQAKDRLGQEISTEEDAMMEPYRVLFRKTTLSFTERLQEGTPSQAIIRAAQEEGCDLILMGARSRTDLEGLILGSVSHEVLREAPCPVLFIR